ncbi:MAG TPA: LacI family DNA-binding transcriptional regulator [Chthonomonadaceae bacterium]|nr:LacI family DNA-binding transcriptional regulator [Chthonomonadaceae bacterium]
MATIVDVAKRARVSPGTASRVLNNKMVMPISPLTVARIRQAAEELGYRPNALARALALRKTHTLGLCYDVMTDPHFARMLEAVEAKARALGYRLLVSSEPESLVHQGVVDGLLIVGLPESYAANAFPAGKAVAFISPAQEPAPRCVVWSDFEGVSMATRYLLRLGHRQIAALLGEENATRSFADKRAGFRHAMAESGAAGYEYAGALHSDRIENGYLLTRRLLSEHPDITALFARNDYLALGAMEALREAGLNIPEQVSVVGYNDTLLARCASPHLTSVRTPFAEAGVLALERLVEAIECGVAEFPGALLPVTLTERDSCAPPPTHSE